MGNKFRQALDFFGLKTDEVFKKAKDVLGENLDKVKMFSLRHLAEWYFKNKIMAGLSGSDDKKKKAAAQYLNTFFEDKMPKVIAAIEKMLMCGG